MVQSLYLNGLISGDFELCNGRIHVTNVNSRLVDIFEVFISDLV